MKVVLKQSKASVIALGFLLGLTVLSLPGSAQEKLALTDNSAQDTHDASETKDASATDDSDSVKLRPVKKVTVTAEEPVKPGFLSWKTDTLGRVRSDGRLAKRLAKYHWLDKIVLANPELSEAITNHRRAAMILADHVRITEIAEADPYLCRRITKWKGAARRLAANPNARYVIDRDPEGMYRAIRRDKKIIRILSKNPVFDQMIVDNPELGRVISHYM